MMLNKNTKAMVWSPDGGSNFFDIVTSVLQEDAPYMLIIFLSAKNANISNKNGFIIR